MFVRYYSHSSVFPPNWSFSHRQQVSRRSDRTNGSRNAVLALPIARLQCLFGRRRATAVVRSHWSSCFKVVILELSASPFRSRRCCASTKTRLLSAERRLIAFFPALRPSRPLGNSRSGRSF